MTSPAYSGGFVPPLLNHTTVRESEETQVAHVERAMSLGLKQLDTPCRAHGHTLSIVGGGPSLADTYKDLTGYIVAINGSLKWLLDRGVVPYACGVLDPGDHIADALVAEPRVRFFVSSTCHPSVFEKLKDCTVTLWHPGGSDIVNKAIFDRNPEATIVGGGCTMGLRWFTIGYMLGFRKFKCFGMDSCFTAERTHAYPDWKDDNYEKFFKTRGWLTSKDMMQQVADYIIMRERFRKGDVDPIEIEMFGNHLMREAHDFVEEAHKCLQ